MYDKRIVEFVEKMQFSVRRETVEHLGLQLGLEFVLGISGKVRFRVRV